MGIDEIQTLKNRMIFFLFLFLVSYDYRDRVYKTPTSVTAGPTANRNQAIRGCVYVRPLCSLGHLTVLSNLSKNSVYR